MKLCMCVCLCVVCVCIYLTLLRDPYDTAIVLFPRLMTHNSHICCGVSAIVNIHHNLQPSGQAGSFWGLVTRGGQCSRPVLGGDGRGQ